MKLFKKREKKEEEIDSRIKMNLLIKSALFVLGCMISAVSFNLFYVTNNFVGGGLGGVAVIINSLFNINSTTVVVIGNIIFITISIFTLGFQKSLMSILGAAVYTLFVYFTEDIGYAINFKFDDVILYVIAAGVGGGFGDALVFKTGFNTGGSSIVAEIISHYTKQPLGKILRYISVVVIALGGFTFGYTAIMYSIIIAFISTYVIDRFLLGIGDSKLFIVQTSEANEVKKYILDTLECGITEFNVKGAFTHRKKDLFMCVVPTEKYPILKSRIKDIDPSAFIIVSDCYEVLGGTKVGKLLMDE